MRILILLDGAIGDSLLGFPILRALRARYVGADIAFVSNAVVLPLAKSWGLADEVYDFTHIRHKKLNPPSFEYTVDFLRMVQQADLVVEWLVSFRVMDKTLQHLLTVEARKAMVDERREELLGLGAKKAIVVLGFLGHDSQHLVEQFIEPLNLDELQVDRIAAIKTGDSAFCAYKPPIAIHPGSAEEVRLWPAASFAEIINRLMRRGQPVLLLAGPADTEQLRNVRSQLSAPAQARLLTILKNAPLLEVARQLKQCTCFLGNDSGMTHLAALLGVPTIALFLPAYIVTMHPLGPSVEVIAEANLNRLSVDRVFESVQKYV